MIRKFIFFFFAFIVVTKAGYSQCSTTNATSCRCADSTQTDCDLLPDIEASEYGFRFFSSGPNEYPQTGAGTNYNGQGPDDGRLRVSASTPNVGHGTFEVYGVDGQGYRWFLCGTDTFSIHDPNATQQFTCPNNHPNPLQLLKQRVYHKNGTAMTYTDRFSGSMTYHPAHGHYHVDDWEHITLRIENPLEPNPLRWPVVGRGNKVGFCLMDFGSCTSGQYVGHCHDTLGTVLDTQGEFPNYGLGGQSYSCSQIKQGISSGWTDVYGEHLEGQWLDIPPGTCNGDYYVVIEVDPYNNWLEETKSNNFFASPITLTQQSPSGTPIIEISSSYPHRTICAGDSIMLTATAGTTILWNNGETTQDIWVPTTSGTYSVTVTNHCGTGTASYTVQEVVSAEPTVTGDTVCPNTPATLTAIGTGTITWLDGTGTQVGTGTSFTTPSLASTTTYYAVNNETYSDTAFTFPHNNDNGGGDWVQSDQYNIFDALIPMDIVSARVYAQAAGNRRFYLKDNGGAYIDSITVNVPAGESRVVLDFDSIPVGTGYRLGASATTGNLKMYRNNSARISYPFTLDGVLSINGSSGGASYYYYLYDWEVVNSQANCSSDQVPVLATVDTCGTLGLDFYFENSIKLFPNPSDGNVNISFESVKSGDVSIMVTDLSGKTISLKNLNAHAGKYNEKLDISGIAKGVYVLGLEFEGKTYFRKLVIQ